MMSHPLWPRAIFELTFSLLFCGTEPTRNHNYLLYLISRAVIAAAYLLADVTGKSYLPHIFFDGLWMLNNVGYLISIIVVGLRRDGNEKPAARGKLFFRVLFGRMTRRVSRTVFKREMP
jgi:hypothetical protein